MVPPMPARPYSPAYKAMLEDAKKRRAEALAMVEEEGKTVQQVADIMDVSKQRVSQMITRARIEKAEEPGL